MKSKYNHNETTTVAGPWVGTATACNYLGISIPTLRRWVKAKKIIPKRTPTGALRFRQTELDTLLG